MGLQSLKLASHQLRSGWSKMFTPILSACQRIDKAIKNIQITAQRAKMYGNTLKEELKEY